jgi:hypothetical protein
MSAAHLAIFDARLANDLISQARAPGIADFRKRLAEGRVKFCRRDATYGPPSAATTRAADIRRREIEVIKLKGMMF